MKLINKEIKKMVYKCDNCKDSVYDICRFERNFDLCETCLIKAVLLVRPIEFDKETIIAILRFGDAYLKRSEQAQKDYFIEFVKPFLDSK